MTAPESQHQSANAEAKVDFDVVIVGASFAGLGMLYQTRELGLRARVYDAADGVGGTWYWNRYPGARTDSECYYYCFSFSEELLQEWEWSERYPGQPEMLRYLDYVADKFDLRRDIQFETRVDLAVFDESSDTWTVSLSDGSVVSTTYLVTGLGLLSTPYIPDIPGLDRFSGERYLTAQWPHEDVDFTGKRVGVIGTGATGIPVVPEVAKQADHLTVFQRTPNYAVPNQNGPMDREYQKSLVDDYDNVLAKAQAHSFAMPFDPPGRLAVEEDPKTRREVYEAGWRAGGFRFLFETFEDILVDEDANDTAAGSIRSKIRQIVDDPDTAEALSPRGYPYAAKRPPAEQGYYEAFNRDNVTLVDIKSAPIQEVTPTGIRTSDQDYELDVIILATGFDAVTGTLEKMNIRGRDGVTLKDKWKSGPRTYLGLTAHDGFPNLFMISGPGSPFANIPVCVEKNVEWIRNAISYMRENGVSAIEPTAEAEDGWVDHVQEVVDQTLLPRGASVQSWFTGANIPGKSQVVNVYFGGANDYFDTCDDVAEKGHEGFALTSQA